MPFASWPSRLVRRSPELALAGLLLLGLALPGEAQTTGTPVFLAPYRAFQRHELALSFSDPGEGWVLEGMVRSAAGTRSDFGFRLGVGDTDHDSHGFGPSSTYFVAGFDFRHRMIRHTESFPLDGALTLGVGGIFGDGFQTGLVPIGVSLGRRVELEGTTTSFTPYFHPVLAPLFGDTGEDDVQFGIGLGVDIRFSSRADFRIGAGLGDFDGLSLSLSFMR